jgi:hypothetical protein
MPSNFGGLLDPATMGLLSAASAGLQASGPSRMPTSIGQILGAGTQAGLNAYSSTLDAQRKYQQTQALVELEQEKAKQARLATMLSLEQANMKRQFLGLPPIGLPGQGMPQGMPLGMPQSAPQGLQASQPTPMPQSPLGLPGHFGQAARADLALGSGAKIPDIIMKANEPVVGREGGIFKRNPDGSLVIDPGWLQGEEARQRLKQKVENENSVVTEATGIGDQRRTMTKAQQLQLATGQASPMGQYKAPNIGIAPNESAAENLVKAASAQGKGMTVEVRPDLQPGYVSGKSPEQEQKEAGAKAFETETAKDEAGLLKEIREQADAARKANVNYGYQLDLIKRGMFGGKLAPGIQGAAEFLNGMGIPIGADEMRNTQNFKKVAEEGALSQIKMFVGSQNISDADRKAVESIVARIQDDPEARVEYLNFLQHRAAQSLAKESSAKEYVQQNQRLKGFTFTPEAYVPKTKETKSSGFDSLPPAKNYRGKRIRDKETGKVFKSDGMKWKEE